MCISHVGWFGCFFHDHCDESPEPLWGLCGTSGVRGLRLRPIDALPHGLSSSSLPSTEGLRCPSSPQTGSAPELTPRPGEPAVKRTRGLRQREQAPWLGRSLGRESQQETWFIGWRGVRRRALCPSRVTWAAARQGRPSSSPREVGARMEVLAVAPWGRLWQGGEGAEVWGGRTAHRYWWFGGVRNPGGPQCWLVA